MPWSTTDLPKNVKGMDLSAHQIDVFVKAANAALKEYGDDATAIKVGISAAKKANSEKENDMLPGGKSDNMTLEQIAEKHGVELSELKKQFDKGVKVESEHTDIKEEAEEIAKDHLFEDAEYYTKLTKMEGEKTNSKDWAKVYRAVNFIEKGVCTYKDETIYLSQETLQKAMPTMKGRPVVIQHQKVTPDNMQDFAVGYVTDRGDFDNYDASFSCPFVVFDDEGKEVIANDYSVSCAYIPKAFGQGGTWHNTPYDREVTDLEFTHLALVPDPRYEDAKIYENSMSEENNENKETYNMEKIEVEQGFLSKLMEMAQKPFLNAKEEEKSKEDKDEDEMEYEGEKYSKKELVNCFKAKKNEAEKEKEDEDSKEDKKEDKKEEEKKNSKEEEQDGMEFFNSMKAKMEQAKADPNDRIKPYSQSEGIELGKKIFG